MNEKNEKKELIQSIYNRIDNDIKNNRLLIAELVQKKYGSTVDVDDFFNLHKKSLSSFAEKIDPNEIETFCEDDCTIVKIIPQIIIDNPIRDVKDYIPEKIYFGDDSEKIGYKSFQYFCSIFNNKLILVNLDDDEIIITGDDISIKMEEIIKKVTEL
jgi:hypothetical protein